MRIGLLAGTGRLPALLAERAGFHARVDLHRWTKPLGAVEALVDTLQSQGCDALCFAGGVDRAQFIGLDAGGQWIMEQLSDPDVGDSALLDALVAYVEERGLRVVGAGDVLPDLRTPSGTLSGTRPAGVQEGLARARALGLRDVGQAVVTATDGRWFEEDAAGTDALMARAADAFAADAGQLKLFKAAKPQQDLRVDMPAWGLETVQTALRYGFEALVFEADRTLALDLEPALALAKEGGLSIVGEPVS